jgi:hypothetical protein
MNDRKWERWSALGGILFVALILASAFLPGSPPKTGDSAAKIAKFVADERDEIRWAGYLAGLAILPLFWFAGAVWRLMRRAEGDNPRLTVVAALGVGFAALMGALGGIILGVLGILGVAGSGGASGTKFFYVLSANVGVATSFGAAVFVGALSVVMIRTGVLPRALGWIGALIAVLFTVGGAVVASTRDVFFDLSFAGFLAFSIWLIVVSVLMFMAAGREPAASPA